ncbi:ROK family protein [Ruania alba]|uniref:Sugar kinase of the NBD/HSP70 family, may contain an N-terminal HTH domain n=1 Tax=Ruania alba TaxID=648782 RepID=A0A1H5M6P8_9MICO|nr:ROK family protein [Ruania alba]SEE84823.1 Sugar kinase of the NBD/HSP70 family, may contain an N-terminal HTH domain [Ruania alba]
MSSRDYSGHDAATGAVREQEGRGLDSTTDGLSNLSRLVAVDILVHGAQPRASVGERMGISAATVTRLVRPLLDAGVLVETELLRTPGRGRSAIALDVVPDRYRFVGVKLTRDTLYAVVTDLRAQELGRHSEPLESLDVRDVVAAVTAVVRRFEADAPVPVTAVGVTVGGHVEEDERVANSTYLHWQDVPMRALLEEQGLPRVHLANDVVGLTKVQHWFGAGRGHASFALLTVGVGIGYGLVVNHERVDTRISPISHFPVDPAGPPCPKGHRGCLTAMLTSEAIAASVSVGHRQAVSFEEALILAESGDAVAARTVRDAARGLGRAAAAVATMTGVERIVLSGDGVHLAEIEAESLYEGYREYELGEPEADGQSQPDLVVQPMDFFEWARGAAAVAIQAEFPL